MAMVADVDSEGFVREGYRAVLKELLVAIQEEVMTQPNLFFQNWVVTPLIEKITFIEIGNSINFVSS